MCVENHSPEDELKAELAELNRRKAELEARLRGEGRPAERKDRRRLDAQIEFIADFDIVRARGINLSEGGICFEVEEDLPFEMRFELEGSEHQKRARLVWMERLPNGGYRLGFEFLSGEEESDLL